MQTYVSLQLYIDICAYVLLCCIVPRYGKKLRSIPTPEGEVGVKVCSSGCHQAAGYSNASRKAPSAAMKPQQQFLIFSFA